MTSATLTFEALGDSTRRAIVESLRAGPLPVGEIARRLPVSRPAVSRHLRLLKQAGLVADTAQGTRRLYRLDPAGIGVARAYLDEVWDEALDRFRAAAEQAEATRSGRTTDTAGQGQP